jgi:hypothetical protein
MSPSVIERTTTESCDWGIAPESAARGLPDANFFPLDRATHNVNRYARPMNLLEGYIRRQARYGHTPPKLIGDQQRETLSFTGSRLAAMNFAVFDYTGTDTLRVSQLVTELALGARSPLREPIRILSGHVEVEPVTADFDQTIDGTWLAAAFDAVFVGSAGDDTDLEFDPDDFPTF